MTAIHYLIIGVIAYTFFLITSLPATTVIGFISKSTPQVKIQGITGTLWNGSAQRISLPSQQVINDVNWSFCTWRLLTAEACVNMDATFQKEPIQAQLGIGITGTLMARDLSAKMDARLLGGLAGLPVGELAGLITIQLDSASWARDHIPNAIGTVHWNNAAVTVAETANLGDVAITLAESNDFPLMAIINNKGGQIALDGKSHISDDGTYDLELKLSPDNTASKNLRSTLGMFAKQQNDGSFVLKNAGNLKQLGII
jgi:general secretion pathway protein N